MCAIACSFQIFSAVLPCLSGGHHVLVDHALSGEPCNWPKANTWTGYRPAFKCNRLRMYRVRTCAHICVCDVLWQSPRSSNHNCVASVAFCRTSRHSGQNLFTKPTTGTRQVQYRHICFRESPDMFKVQIHSQGGVDCAQIEKD